MSTMLFDLKDAFLTVHNDLIFRTKKLNVRNRSGKRQAPHLLCHRCTLRCSAGFSHRPRIDGRWWLQG